MSLLYFCQFMNVLAAAFAGFLFDHATVWAFFLFLTGCQFGIHQFAHAIMHINGSPTGRSQVKNGQYSCYEFLHEMLR